MLSPQPAKRNELDTIIDQIDESLSVIHRMCKSQLKQKKAPTDRLPSAQAQQAKVRLQELSEDPIVVDDQVTGIRRINGAG